MANPLFNGNSAAMIGNIPVPPQVMETIQSVFNMIQSGADLYTVIKALKEKNITPQAVERGLYLAMPQLRNAKQKLMQIGINPKEVIGQLMKENNISETELKSMITDFAKQFKKK